MLRLAVRLFGVLLAVVTILMTRPTGETAEVEHPEWCDPAECKTYAGGSRDHRSHYLEIARVGLEPHELQSQLSQATGGNGVMSIAVDAWSEEIEPGMPDGFYEQTLILSLRQADLLAKHLAELVAAAGGPDDPARTSETEV